MHWLIYSFLAASCWMLFHIGARLSSQVLNPMLASVVASITAVSIGLCWYKLSPGTSPMPAQASSVKYWGYAVLMGMGAGFGDVIYVLLHKKSIPFSIAAPVTLVMLYVLLCVFGVLFFNEDMTTNRILGVIFGALSVFFLAR